MLLQEGQKEGAALVENRLRRRTIGRIVRVVAHAVIAVALFLASVYAYSRVDRFIWASQLHGLIGHPASDLMRLRSPSTGFDVVATRKEYETIIRFFAPRTDIQPRGKVVVAYRHTVPGLWAALVFLDQEECVYAVQVGTLDSRSLEEAARHTRKALRDSR